MSAWKDQNDMSTSGLVLAWRKNHMRILNLILRDVLSRLGTWVVGGLAQRPHADIEIPISKFKVGFWKDQCGGGSIHNTQFLILNFGLEGSERHVDKRLGAGLAQKSHADTKLDNNRRTLQAWRLAWGWFGPKITCGY